MSKRITSLHDKNNLTENKLILLYIAKKLGVKLSYDQFYVLVDKYKWMNYFDMRECIIDLSEAGFLSNESDCFTITANGLELLDIFKKSIILSIRTTIDEYANNNRLKIKIDQQIYADYSQDSENEYPVVFKIIENEVEIFSARLVASNTKEAKSLVREFKKKAPKIYANMIKELTSDL
jgi:hypothetical protein